MRGEERRKEGETDEKQTEKKSHSKYHLLRRGSLYFPIFPPLAGEAHDKIRTRPNSSIVFPSFFSFSFLHGAGRSFPCPEFWGYTIFFVPHRRIRLCDWLQELQSRLGYQKSGKERSQRKKPRKKKEKAKKNESKATATAQNQKKNSPFLVENSDVGARYSRMPGVCRRGGTPLLWCLSRGNKEFEAIVMHNMRRET